MFNGRAEAPLSQPDPLPDGLVDGEHLGPLGDAVGGRRLLEYRSAKGRAVTPGSFGHAHDDYESQHNSVFDRRASAYRVQFAVLQSHVGVGFRHRRHDGRSLGLRHREVVSS